MKFAAKAFAALIVATTATSALAQVYGEVGYNAVDYKEAGRKASLGSLSATVGYNFHKNLAVEGFVATGIADDDVRVSGLNVNVEAKTSYGVFLKPKVALSDSFEVFAKLGWVESKIGASVANISVSEKGSDFAYGLGAQYNVSKKVYLSGGYNSFYSKNDVKVEGWNVGIGYKF